MTETTYRWNTSQAAEAFDQAAEFIHPFYLTIQGQILTQLPFASDAAFFFVDLGGGSGRLVERVLERFPDAMAVLVDQSEPFLALAERRLRRFGERALLIQRRLQDDWPAELAAAPQVIVSMSAIHHLNAAEKQTLFARCHDTLAEGGVFINGDEYRPESDAEYLAQLQWWADHMNAAMARGQVPASFKPVLDAWHDRNIRRFGEAQQSGGDCLETVAAQLENLNQIGFQSVKSLWGEKLWAIVAAHTSR